MKRVDKIKVSVAIITKNEEKRLPDCLKSVFFADDIVVVDSGSTDKTAQIAESFGCRVFVEEWKGFANQKNSAIQKCKNEWVIVLDADERVPLETKDLIANVLITPSNSAYSFKMKHFIAKRWLKYGGHWPDWHVRLINKNKGAFYGEIHERWETNEGIGKINGCIEHYGFSNYSDMLRNVNDYSSIAANELFEKGRRVNMIAPVAHAVAMFFKIYILQKGILDGFDGVVMAIAKAGGSFFKYAKLYELQRREKT